jgi:hypothetical protein
MVDKVQVYFAGFLNKGDVDVAKDIFDDECVHIDVVWDSLHPSIGPKGLEHYLRDLKTAFPDFHVAVEALDIAQGSTTSLWVSYEGSCTGLGTYHDHKATKHMSVFKGVNVFKFNDDRSKIVSVEVYRSAFQEDRAELVEVVKEGGFRDLRLQRLV